MTMTIAVATDTDALLEIVHQAAEGMDAEVVRTNVRDVGNWGQYGVVIYDTEQIGGEVAEVDGELDWRMIVDVDDVADAEQAGLAERIRTFLTAAAADGAGGRKA